MSLTKLTDELMKTGARVGPMRFLGAVNPVYEADAEGAGGGGGSDDGGGASDDGGAADDKSATDDKGGNLLGDVDSGEGEGDGNGDDPDKEKADAEKAKAKAKADRKAELDAMSDEDRAKAEAEDAKAEHDGTVPEDGVYDLTMPDGVEVDQELLGELAPEFKAAGLTNGEAQKLADKFAGVMQTRAEAKAKDWAKQVSDWGDEVRNDPDMGGDNYETTKANAVKGLRAFGSPKLITFFKETGFGNEPELVRAFAKVGATVADDDPAISENPGGAKAASDPATVMYPNDQPQGK